MIELCDIKKHFRGKPALHGVSLKVEKGEIFGLLGHNGAGKSTSFGIMLGHVQPDAGEAFIGGISVQKSRAQALKKVGAIFEAPCFYDYLSGWQNLQAFCSYSGVVSRSEMEEAVELVGLAKRIHDKVRTYSHGMRQRLGLAQALLPAPEVLLLDEPTEGLDPEGIHEIRNTICTLSKERGLTVLLSSHLLSEVEQMCDRVAVLSQGRLLFTGRWEEMDHGKPRVRFTVNDWDRAAKVLGDLQRDSSARVTVVEPGLIELPDPSVDIADLVAALVRADIRVRGVEPIRQSLEASYLETIKNAQS